MWKQLRRCYCSTNPANQAVRSSALGTTAEQASSCSDPQPSSAVRQIQHVRDVDAVCSPGDKVNIKGWLFHVTKMKGTLFTHLVDGVSHHRLQLLFPRHTEHVKDIKFGAAVDITGEIVESPGPMQKYELVVEDFKVTNVHLPDDNPIQPRVNYPPEYLRRHMHVRPKARPFTALLRVRSQLTMIIHQYFQEKDYVLVQTPAITTNDCEGGGEVFKVDTDINFDESASPSTAAEQSAEAWEGDEEEKEALEEARLTEASQRGDKDAILTLRNRSNTGKYVRDRSKFFGRDAFLTPSSQLHLEAVANSIKQVYCLSPAFRAETSRRRITMAEFYMLEAELAFMDTLPPLLNVVEDFIRFSAQALLNKCAEDIGIIEEYNVGKDKMPFLSNFLERLDGAKSFPTVTFEEARKMLENSNRKFVFPIENDLKKEHEWALVEMHDQLPVFVTHWPKESKPFYTRLNGDGTKAECFDLLCPVVGEVCSGSLRENDFDRLSERCSAVGNLSLLQWYVDLRKLGHPSTGGFGIGFDRYIQVLTGIHSTKDTLPFPRSKMSLYL